MPLDLTRFNTDADIDAHNFALFKDCLTSRVLLSLSGGNASEVNSADTASEDLDEFTAYLAAEAWQVFPEHIRHLSYIINTGDTTESAEGGVDQQDGRDNDALISRALDTLQPSFADTLRAYALVLPPSSSPTSSSTSQDFRNNEDDEARTFLQRVLEAYVPLAMVPPPASWSSTQRHASACEICEREVPLTYHHLIPREMHDKARRRGWHRQEMLGSVAWLCRPCHSVVHSVASNEELAREFYTLERLLAREDIQRWQKYASTQRWGVRRR